jgi:hypothetical protein
MPDKKKESKPSRDQRLRKTKELLTIHFQRVMLVGVNRVKVLEDKVMQVLGKV